MYEVAAAHGKTEYMITPCKELLQPARCEAFCLGDDENMVHQFDIDIAAKYGVNAAVLLNNIAFWIAHNEANGTNYNDGDFWTYNSRRAFSELFPYLSARQIETALKKLIDDGLLKTGNYNQSAYDRTMWYALTKKGKCIVQKCEMDNAKMLNGNAENVLPIPDINTDIKPDIKQERAASRFQPPTLDDVKAYCAERNNGIDAERFVDYYNSNGWIVGRSKMKDWKAAVRNWERREKSSGSGQQHKAGERYQRDGKWFQTDAQGREFCATAPEDEIKLPF